MERGERLWMRSIPSGAQTWPGWSGSSRTFSAKAGRNPGNSDPIMEKLDTLTRKVDALEAGPGRRWNGLTEKAAWAVCAAVIAFLLGGIGL